MLGRSLGHYDVLEKLGQGGMGVVYKARDRHLDRLVAIKVFLPEMLSDLERKWRFVQEAKAASALNHPHIITVYDISCVDGVDFIAMEHVEGETLAQRIARGGLTLNEALTYAVEIADAVAAAHGAGIIHRDLKPANIMITGKGRIKVLDFGLAKLIESVQAAQSTLTRTVTPHTAAGTILGTAAYMSPEQVEGEPLDARSDVFSFGAVLYEMLSGQQAFHGHSPVATMSAILRDAPAPLKNGRTSVPGDVERVLQRCLEKNRDARYRSAVELHQDLVVCQARRDARRLGWQSVVRRPAIMIPTVLMLLAVVATSAWLWVRSSRETWALDVAVPEIARLADRRDYAAAFDIARTAERYIPGNRRLAELWPEIAAELSIRTSVPGADVQFKEYAAVNGTWQTLGRSPIPDVRVPRGLKRWRITKQGFQTIEAARSPESDGPILEFTLDAEGRLPSDMVRVPGGTFLIWITGLDHLVPPALSDFLMDRYEVTNRQFAEFVQKGGYRRPEYWKQPFLKEGKILAWPDAMSEFRDSTGRPGPATWEAGTFPAGHEDFPVTGVSWYEAAAYAEFAGKTLPTVYHWNRAAWTFAGLRDSSPIVLSSNFGGQGPAPVGEHRAMNPYGTYDLAGNVKEWAWNAADARGATHYILGGAWNEPIYMYNDPDAQSAFNRLPTYGFRCVKYLSGDGTPLEGPLESARRDYSREKPVADDVFRVYPSFYRYDKTKLEPVVESVDDTSDHWKRERVTFNAAYGNERVTAYLFLPRGVNPPYQTIVLFPGSGSLRQRTFEKQSDGPRLDFLVRSGRAVVYPIYKSTYERGDGLLYDRPNLTSGYRDHVIEWYKDFARTLDYLTTRKDLDMTRLGYYGLSWGSTMAPIVLALEPRIKAAVLVIGGFWQQTALPEVEAINFAPRVKTPALMLNGRYDFVFPVDSSQTPMFRLLGTPEPDKRHLLFDSGHSIPRKAEIAEALAWFDRYLGPSVK